MYYALSPKNEVDRYFLIRKAQFPVDPFS